MDWDPRFLDRSPALAAFETVGEPLRKCADWPERDALQRLLDAHRVANARGIALRLVGERSDEAYEARIYLRGEIHLRERNWHDLFNVLAWLVYPRTKAALNKRHHDEALRQSAAAPASGRTRGRVRDALTVFDESGALAVSSDAGLLDDIREFRWKELFWTRRLRVSDAMRVFVFGHALAEKALAPYVGMTAHALLLPVARDLLALPSPRQMEELDALAARAVQDTSAFATPQSLAPLPLLGVPGWWEENVKETFYDDTDYFRPGRSRRT